MNIRSIVALGVLAAAVTACNDDDPVSTNEPQAFVRFINIMPDSGRVDFRFVDRVENTEAFGLAFGQATTIYRGVAAGQRQMRVFRSGTSITTATTVVADETNTLEAGRYYTVLLGGRREGTGAGDIFVFEDDTTAIPARTAGQFALRAFNVSNSAKDVYYRYGPASGANATPLPGTPIPPLPVENGTRSQWVSVDTARIAVAASGTTAASGGMRVAVFAPGTTTPALADVAVTAGVPGTTTVNPSPGARTEGAALTAFILPAPNSGTAGTSSTPTVVFLVDRQANRTAP